jgi:hypothetical protein
MKTILASVCLALSLLLPARAAGYDILLPWLAPQRLGFTSGKAILDFAEDKKRSELDMLVLDKTRSLPADIANAFNKITTPVAASFLAYSRLHNKTVDENNFFSKGIAWSYLVIRLHQADKDNNQTGYVTGWYTNANGSDYRTYGAFESVSRAFIGRWERSGKDGPMELQWRRVDRNGDGKIHDSEGYEHFIHGEADPDNATICGDWVAYSEKLKIQGMEHQKGTMRIILGRLNPEDYSFDMNKVKRSREWNDEKVRKSINDFNNIASILDTKYFPYFFTHEEQEQLVAHYVDKAWEAYQEYLPEDLKKKKEEILDFRVNLMHQVHSNDKYEKGNPLSVPMKFGRRSASEKYTLSISTGTFFTDGVENEEQFKSRLSLIAHEILGHGIFFRYCFESFIEKETYELMKETYELMPWYTKLVILIRRETEGKKAEQIIKEGLAVAVEYAVYQKSGKVNQPSDIKNFTKIRYPSKKAAAYRQGVERLKNKKIIKTDGMLDFGQIELDQKNYLNKSN